MRVKLQVLALCLFLGGCSPSPVDTTVVTQQPLQQEVQVIPQQQQPQYQTIAGPQGQQQVVFYDNGVQQVMEYAMFMSLMNHGGYTNVIHHYHEPYYHTHTTIVHNNVIRSSNSYSRPSSIRRTTTVTRSYSHRR